MQDIILENWASTNSLVKGRIKTGFCPVQTPELGNFDDIKPCDLADV